MNWARTAIFVLSGLAALAWWVRLDWARQAQPGFARALPVAEGPDDSRHEPLCSGETLREGRFLWHLVCRSADQPGIVRLDIETLERRWVPVQGLLNPAVFVRSGDGDYLVMTSFDSLLRIDHSDLTTRQLVPPIGTRGMGIRNGDVEVVKDDHPTIHRMTPQGWQSRLAARPPPSPRSRVHLAGGVVDDGAWVLFFIRSYTSGWVEVSLGSETQVPFPVAFFSANDEHLRSPVQLFGPEMFYRLFQFRDAPIRRDEKGLLHTTGSPTVGGERTLGRYGLVMAGDPAPSADGSPWPTGQILGHLATTTRGENHLVISKNGYFIELDGDGNRVYRPSFVQRFVRLLTTPPARPMEPPSPILLLWVLAGGPLLLIVVLLVGLRSRRAVYVNTAAVIALVHGLSSLIWYHEITLTMSLF